MSQVLGMFFPPTSSTSKVNAPTSNASMMFAACEVDPEASPVLNSVVAFLSQKQGEGWDTSAAFSTLMWHNLSLIHTETHFLKSSAKFFSNSLVSMDNMDVSVLFQHHFNLIFSSLLASKHPKGQVVDEGRDIGAFHRPAVLRTDLHRGGFTDHVLATVARDLVVDAQLQGMQQSACWDNG